MFVSQVVGHPFFGVGRTLNDSISDAIGQVYNEDPISVKVDNEIIPVGYNQKMYRVSVAMESMHDSLSLLINTKEVVL